MIRPFCLRLVLPFAMVALVACGDSPDEPSSTEAVSAEVSGAVAAAEAAYDPGAMDEVLERLETWVAANNPKTTLRNGLDDKTIDRETADLPCKLPEEVRQLYRWHDGTPVSAGDLVWYHRFPKLEHAMDWRRSTASYDPVGWKDSWFPILIFQDEAYLIDCKASKTSSPVLFFSMEDPETPVTYTNLTTMLETHVRAMEEGVVTVEDAEIGSYDADTGALAEIHGELNPGLQFPYR